MLTFYCLLFVHFKLSHYHKSETRADSGDIVSACDDVTATFVDVIIAFGDVTTAFGDVIPAFGDVTTAFGDVVPARH